MLTISNKASHSIQVNIGSTPKRKVVRTLKTIRIILAAMALIAAVAQPVFCGWEWQIQKISEDGAWASVPKIWGDTVYYKDSQSAQNGYLEMKAWSPAEGTRTLTQVPLNTILYSAWQQTLVYAKYDVSTKFDLYSWDPVHGERAISTAPGIQRNADISRDMVVWEDHRSGIEQVWVYDPVDGSRPVSPTSYSQTNPRVDRGRVVWEDMRDGRGDVYMWTAEGGVEKLSTYVYPMMWPEVFGDRAVMTVSWQEEMWDPYGIWEWKAGQGITGPLVPFHYGGKTRMWGDLVAWGNGVYHPSVGVTEMNLGDQFDVYGDSVAWVGAANTVWKATLVSEPSSLLALAGCTGLLVNVRRRRS
jgi:beta propeller repeat protein